CAQTSASYGKRRRPPPGLATSSPVPRRWGASACHERDGPGTESNRHLGNGVPALPLSYPAAGRGARRAPPGGLPAPVSTSVQEVRQRSRTRGSPRRQGYRDRLPAALADDLPLDDDAAHVRRVLERVAVEEDDVAVLPSLERADPVRDPDDPRRIDRHRPERVRERQTGRRRQRRLAAPDACPRDVTLEPALERDRDSGLPQESGGLERRVLERAALASHRRVQDDRNTGLPDL